MPAQVEEVVITRIWCAPEHLGPELAHPRHKVSVRRRYGRTLYTLLGQRLPNVGQPAPVQLSAALRQWQLGHGDKMGGNGVVRQPRLEINPKATEQLRFRLAPTTDDIGHQRLRLTGTRIIHWQHCRRPDVEMGENRCFDRARHDGIAPELDHELGAASDLELTVRQHPADITGAKHAPVIGRDRVRNKALGGHLRLIQITSRQGWPGHVDLAHSPLRHRLQRIIQHINANIGHRPTRRRITPGVVPVYLRQVGGADVVAL